MEIRVAEPRCVFGTKTADKSTEEEGLTRIRHAAYIGSDKAIADLPFLKGNLAAAGALTCVFPSSSVSSPALLISVIVAVSTSGDLRTSRNCSLFETNCLSELIGSRRKYSEGPSTSPRSFSVDADVTPSAATGTSRESKVGGSNSRTSVERRYR